MLEDNKGWLIPVYNQNHELTGLYDFGSVYMFKIVKGKMLEIYSDNTIIFSHYKTARALEKDLKNLAKSLSFKKIEDVFLKVNTVVEKKGVDDRKVLLKTEFFFKKERIDYIKTKGIDPAFCELKLKRNSQKFVLHHTILELHSMI